MLGIFIQYESNRRLYYCTIRVGVNGFGFSTGVQEKLGILNNGAVYSVFDYEAHNPDELSFKEGDRLTILRKGDEWEREWWWSRLNDKEGYIPRNLLGVRVLLQRSMRFESNVVLTI